MKKQIYLLILLLSVFCLAGCGEQTAEDAPVYTISESEIYTEEEITKAMDAMVDYFYDHSENCTLKKVTYEERGSVAIVETNYADFIEMSGNDDIIILTAIYDIEERASESNLIPARECINLWAMLRTDGKWSYFDDLGVYQEGINHLTSE